MFIDTHAHYDDPKFNEGRDELLEEIHAFGVEAIINCARTLRAARLR